MNIFPFHFSSLQGEIPLAQGSGIYALKGSKVKAYSHLGSCPIHKKGNPCTYMIFQRPKYKYWPYFPKKKKSPMEPGDSTGQSSADRAIFLFKKGDPLLQTVDAFLKRQIFIRLQRFLGCQEL